MTAMLAPAKPMRDRSGCYDIGGVKCMAVADIVRAAVPRPDLAEWTADEVARCAVDRLPALCRMRGAQARERSVRWLRDAASAKMRDAMALGRAVHDLVESRLLERPIGQVAAEHRPYLEAFDHFRIDRGPAFEATELLVANPAERYAGKADAWAVLPDLGGGVLLIDWQTGHGVYPETALRLAAFRRATVAWTKDSVAVELPPVESAVVVHLRPDRYPSRGYAIYPVNTSDAAFDLFRRARDIALDWSNGLASVAIGDPF